MTKLTLFSLGLALLTAGCSSNDDPYGGSEGKTINLTTEEIEIADDAQKFQYDFFAAAYDIAGNNENVVVSPVSAHILISMLANAADNQGRGEILSAMGCDGVAELNAYNRRILDYLPMADRSVTLALANSVWYSKEYALNKSFSDVLGNSYLAPSYKRDFDDSALVGEINRWCSDNTGKMIPEIVNNLESNVKLFLSNAMFFKGDWSSPFNESNNKRETFFGATSETTVDMMHVKGAFMDFIVDERFKAGKKKFGKNNAYYVWFMLPEEGVDMETALEEFMATDKGLCAPYVFDATVDFALPKFAFTTKTMNLQSPLEKMGITSIFRRGGITSFETPFNGFWEVEQKVSIEFNEKGAKAAAVTTGKGEATAYIPETKEQTLILDRPFMFFIQERTTGSLLVAGCINDING